MSGNDQWFKEETFGAFWEKGYRNATVKKHTRHGGFNIFTLFVYNENYPLVKEIESAQYKNSFCENELQEFYQDWIEHRYDQYVKWDAHPGIPLHYHPIEKLVSQKPLVKIKKEKLKVIVTLSEEVFASISMEMSNAELKFRIGEPECIERMHMDGMQLGIAKGNETGSQSTINGYNLELWFYGKYAFYMVNGEVAGKALYATEPIRLRIEC